jgi:hypothetical protein
MASTLKRFHIIAAAVVLLSFFIAGSAFAGTATLTGPVSPIPSQPAHFTWTNAAADLYVLYVGSTPGGYDLYWEYLNTDTSKDVYGLPHDGSTLYATVWSLNSGVWTSSSAVYTAITNSVNEIAVLTAPVPTNGTGQFTVVPVNFTWNAPDPGYTADMYWIELGSSYGRSDYASLNCQTNLSRTASGVPPAGGLTVYTRLWTRIQGQGWFHHDYTYTTVDNPISVATLTSPTEPSTFSGDPVHFVWASSAAASTYCLYIGSTLGGTEYYWGYQGLNTTKDVYGLPHDSSTVYVRLWTMVSGDWYFRDYTFTAWNGGTPGIAEMQTPANGSTNLTQPITFTWAAGANGDMYWISIGNALGYSNLYDQSQGANLTANISGLPAGTHIYVRLWTHVVDSWNYHDYDYTTAP